MPLSSTVRLPKCQIAPRHGHCPATSCLSLVVFKLACYLENTCPLQVHLWHAARPLNRRSRTTFFLGWSAAPLDPFRLVVVGFAWAALPLSWSPIFWGSLLSVTISSSAVYCVSRSTGQSIILQCKKFVYRCRHTTHIKTYQ